ncbi:amidase [Acetobacter musti]|uniref:Amidase n=1 Tax=Acetobacter musti TaxID=864732 RepID=A0ABX0JQQ8_9PROT|nr:amidase family protein [Acetobacter musti]NHN84865.1 amidase [Acetobacter musti]
MSSSLCLWSASRMAEAVRKRDISSRECVDAALERVRVLNPRLNAIVDEMADEALAAADEADRVLRADAPVGPLHGVPVTIKDNVDQKGRATTSGVVALRDNIAGEDSPQVASLKAAGAVIIGRTNTPAFSLRWFTDNDLHGRTLSPWRDDVTPGGSSGGAAVAVATGMGALAHGNDFGGSVRYPAVCCGVAGLRATTGRIPMATPGLRMPGRSGAGQSGAGQSGAGPGGPGQGLSQGVGNQRPERGIAHQLMAAQGLLARNVEDLWPGLRAMMRPDARDPGFVPAPLDYATPFRCGRRVALFRGPASATVDASVLAALDSAAAALREAGFRVEEAVPPDFEVAARLWYSLASSDMSDAGRAVLEDLGGKAVCRLLELAPDQKDDAVDLQACLRQRFALAREWSVFLNTYDLLLLPVSFAAPFPVDKDQRSAEDCMAVLQAQYPLLATALSGLPGLSVPTGLANGLPVGVQLVADRFREDLCLLGGAAIEKAFGTVWQELTINRSPTDMADSAREIAM